MEMDESGYVSFGDVARENLGMQCQYASRYITGFPDHPDLGKGLRFLNLDMDNYHAIRIHRDDVPEIVRRIRDYRNQPRIS